MSKSMTKSGVPWADYRWNPIEGCSQISEGCQHCYAASFAHRFKRHWGSPIFHPEKLGEPNYTKRPGRVFVCSTSDLFHEDIKGLIDWRARILAAMDMAPWHTYLILTKRPQNIPPCWGPRENIWLGVTAENQARYDERWNILKDIRSRVRFVSVEPMLGPLTTHGNAHQRPDWVICGPENGAKKRPCDPKWIDALSDESLCFFDKRPTGKRKEYPQ
jgi:protein gp37